jgi:hypothetical protein
MAGWVNASPEATQVMFLYAIAELSRQQQYSRGPLGQCFPHAPLPKPGRQLR